MPNPTGLWVFIGSLLYVANGIAGVVFKTGDDPIEIQDNSGSVNDCQFISISIDRLIHDACVSVTAPHNFIGDLRFDSKHPNDGTIVTLLNRPGYPSSPFCAGCPPKTISFYGLCVPATSSLAMPRACCL